MSRVCDRCGSDGVARKYVEKIQGSELDLCAPCDELLCNFLSEPKKEKALWKPEKEKATEDITQTAQTAQTEDDGKRGRHKRTA